MIKICCISDLHGHLIDIPKCDIVLCSGDILPLDIQNNPFQSIKWLKNTFASWRDTIDAEYFVTTVGNHDFIFENVNVEIDGVDVLIDNWITINELKIYGSPWSPRFCEWAFMPPQNVNSEEFLQKKYDLIPNDTDIILSHGPPYGLCDKTIGGKLTGSKSLTNRIFDKTFTKLSAVVCGHIHEANGVFCLGDHVMADGHNCDIVNCSILDENYRVKNKPWEFVLC